MGEPLTEPLDPPSPPVPAKERPSADARTIRSEAHDGPPDPSQATIALSGAPVTTTDSRDFQGEPFGRYRLLLELGRGGMGVVHKAWDTQLRRPVALKQVLAEGGISRAQVDRFLREARLSARLRHPHIVGVLDVSEHQGRPYLTTEFIEARSLEAVLRDPVPPARAIAWVKAIAEALQYAHENGIVHRDVKPSNVLIDTQGRPFLTDFGLAKEVEEQAVGGTTMTLSGTLVGTPQYMSPEQASGRPERIGPAADQFSLGVVLYEALTGKLPFQGNGLRELLNAISELDPDLPTRWVPRLHPDLETICLKAIEKAPERRYATIGAMAADLGRHLDGEPIEARAPSLAGRLLRKARKHWAVTLPTAAALLLAVGFAAYAVGTHLRHVRELEESLSREQSMRRQLEEAAAVSAVFARWGRLSDALTEMEGIAYDSSLRLEERRARCAGPMSQVKAFLEATPQDRGAQAAALALTGWAHLLAGEGSEGNALMLRASEVDPDVPYGALMRALALFSGEIDDQSLPGIEVGTAGVEIGPAEGETAAMRDARARILALVDEVGRARVWGRQGSEENRVAIDGLLAMRNGDYAAADEALSQALAAVDLRMVRASLFLARGKVRYLRKEFSKALADLQEVERVRPAQASVRECAGLIHHAMAEEASIGGTDPIPEFRRSIEEFTEALRLDPSKAYVLGFRGNVYARLGFHESACGLDASESLRKAIADQQAAANATHGNASVCANLAAAWLMLAEIQAGRGEDPRGALQSAIAVLSAAIEADASLTHAWVNRGMAFLRLGDAERGCGEDPMASYGRAEADCREAVKRIPENGDAHVYLGNTLLRLGEAAAAEGLDPAARLGEAVAEFERAIERLPGSLDAYVGEGLALWNLGNGEARRGLDPRETYDRALAAYDKAAALNPRYVSIRSNRAATYAAIAEAEDARGIDPRGSFGKAIEELGESIRLNPQDAGPYSSRAYAQVLLGEAEAAHGGDPRDLYRSAIADGDAAIERNPAWADVYNHRGLARSRLGEAEGARGEGSGDRFQKALEDFQAALDRNPRFWRAYMNAGRVYELQARPSKAAECYAAALAIQPADWLKADLERAKAAAAERPAWAATVEEGDRAFGEGDFAKARAAYEKAIEAARANRPSTEQSLVVLVTAHYRLAAVHAFLSVGRDARAGDPHTVAPEEAARCRDEAFRLLSAAAALGWRGSDRPRNDADLAPLHNDPRWAELLRRLGD